MGFQIPTSSGSGLRLASAPLENNDSFLSKKLYIIQQINLHRSSEELRESGLPGGPHLGVFRKNIFYLAALGEHIAAAEHTVAASLLAAA